MVKSDQITVYHYTTSQALLSILNKKSIWFTNVRFMNDTAELKYPIELLKNTIDSFSYGDDQQRSDVEKYFHEHVIPKVEERSTRQYILSFSFDADSLHLWNYYGRNEGYAIGFSLPELMDILSSKTAMLLENSDYRYTGFSIFHGKVLYQYDLQQQFVKDSVKLFISFLDIGRSLEDSADKQSLLKHINNLRFLLYAALYNMKYLPHSVENEFRICIIPNDDFRGALFRERNGLIIPFVEVGNITKPIKEIVIGPKVHDENALQGIQAILQHRGMEKVKISRSKLEIR